jgi:uncharacterized membrane protein AbrB (regulator of aidB expression)
MKKQISVANLVMLVGGAITFLFSFFDFIGSGSVGTSAWGTGLFPVATIPAILGAAMVVICVLELVGTKLPEPVLTFNWRQILLTWGIVAFTIMLAFLLLDKTGRSLQVGGILMLLGSVAMLVGSVLSILGMATNTLSLPGGSSPTSPTSPPPPPPPPTTPPPPPPPT